MHLSIFVNSDHGPEFSPPSETNVWLNIKVILPMVKFNFIQNAFLWPETPTPKLNMEVILPRDKIK